MRFPWKRPDAEQSAERAELEERLTAEQFRVTQKGGTEQPFSGRYHDTKEPGVYRCVVCDAALFDSETKYDSGTGWPSFSQAVDGESVRRLTDRKLGIKRVEARCAACDAHLGHVFPDGPTSTGERFCMNSASLQLDRSAGND